jgi:CheY-like chemotaxis protein
LPYSAKFCFSCGHYKILSKFDIPKRRETDETQFDNMEMHPIIFLVEDDEDDIILFRDALMEVDPQIIFHFATNGLEAIKKLNLMKPSQPHFIFTDLNMPGMNGWKFLEEIKKVKNFKKIPVFILTTSKDVESKAQTLELSAADFFTKPLSGKEMENIIAYVIGILQEH